MARKHSFLEKVVDRVETLKNKPKRDYIDEKGERQKQNNGEMWERRLGNLADFGLKTFVEKPLVKLGECIEKGQVEEAIIQVPIAVTEQLLKILDWINDWIEGWNFSEGELDKALKEGMPSKKDNADQMTQNLPFPFARGKDALKQWTENLRGNVERAREKGQREISLSVSRPFVECLKGCAEGLKEKGMTDQQKNWGKTLSFISDILEKRQEEQTKNLRKPSVQHQSEQTKNLPRKKEPNSYS